MLTLLVKSTASLGQIGKLALVLILMVGVTTGLTIIVMLLLVAEELVTQVRSLVIIQLTTALLAKAELLKLLLLLPTLAPFTFHW